MAVWIDRFLIVALIVVVLALGVTALPSLAGEPLGGQSLLAHMMASGVLVFGLPVFALAFLRYLSPKHSTSKTQTLGYLTIVLTGLITILTVFLCMLPIPSTDQMHDLMSAHGWAGYAMIPAIALMLVGLRSTRSASRHHS